VTEELAVKVVHELAGLNIHAIIGIEAQEAGPADWNVMVPAQDFDITDVVNAMAKHSVRVKFHDGEVVFFPPPGHLPENVEEVEEEAWADGTSCIARYGHPCSRIPCVACGNGAGDWLDPSSMQFGVTEITPEAASRMPPDSFGRIAGWTVGL
jgi:hypothetical protein